MLLDFHRIWSEWVELSLPFLINHCWQASLFFILIIIISYKLKPLPARIRYLLWLMASLKFILPSCIFSLLGQQIDKIFSNIHSLFIYNLSHLPTYSTIHLVIEPIPIKSRNTLLVMHNENYCVIALVWLTVSLVFLLFWYKNTFFSPKIILGETILLNAREALIFEQVKKDLSIRQKVKIIISKNISEVAVLGTCKPVIVLPEHLVEEMTDAELESIFKHELIHVKRFDNLVNSLHKLICSLFWFNPAVWIIGQKLLLERELSCDETVLESGNLSKDYATGLLKVCKFCLGWKNKHFSYALSSNLQRRIEIVMSNSNNSIKKHHKLLVSLVALILVISSAMVGILNNVSALTNSDYILDKGSLFLDNNKKQLPEVQNQRSNYENWKQRVLPTIGKKNSEQAHIYISAKVQRLDNKTGEIKLAIAQQGTNFKLEIQPIETEKTSQNNSFIKVAGEKAIISTFVSNGVSDPLQINYSEPSITFLAEDRANTIEVLLYNLTTKATSKLILPFTLEPSTGLLTCIEN